MKKYLLAIDQGTTSTRAIVFSQYGQIIATSQIEINLSYPENGWVEADPELIWQSTYQVIYQVLNNPKVSPTDLLAMGITNQRETTILWDKDTCKPVYPAIIWQSRQSQAICQQLVELGYQELIKEKTGLVINPYFSGSKIKWIFDHHPELYQQALEGKILFGTIDTYLLYRLTEGKYHLTDYTNASRTMLFNIKDLTWDQEILDLLQIPSQILPKVVDTSYHYGIATAINKIVSNLNLPIGSLVGDQQAALFGQTCFNPGDIKNTYGTGCFVLMNTGNQIINSQLGLLTTIAYKIKDQIVYALEGSVFIGGSAVKWLRDSLEMIEQSSEVERYHQLVKKDNGVYVVPAFFGLGTPYWDNDVRGAIFGLTFDSNKADLITSTVESIAYQSDDVITVMKKEAQINEIMIYVDGGASVNNYLIQFQADISNCIINRPAHQETTALGAAYLAGLTMGLYQDLNQIAKNKKIKMIFTPQMSDQERISRKLGWHKAVEASRKYKNF